VTGSTNTDVYDRSQPSGSLNQAAELQAEGVTVTQDALGELSVDLAEFGWFPAVLPSEEGDSSLGDEEEDGDDDE
jgi:methylated-DNA-protein-cysteine methyltransferase-like protein